MWAREGARVETGTTGSSYAGGRVDADREQELIGLQDGRACADRRPTLAAILETASRRRGGMRPGRGAWRSLQLHTLPRHRRVRMGSDCASSRLAPLRACDVCSCAIGASPGDRPVRQAVELGVEKIDEDAVLGNSTEHLEARPVMGEFGAGRGVVKARGWQQRELPDFGDLVRGEDRDRVGAGVRYAIAQLALAASRNRRSTGRRRPTRQARQRGLRTAAEAPRE